MCGNQVVVNQILNGFGIYYQANMMSETALSNNFGVSIFSLQYNECFFLFQVQPGGQVSAGQAMQGTPQAPAGTYPQQPYGAYQAPGGALILFSFLCHV